MKNLEGKIALITGSTRGIGKAIALEFVNRGAIVLLHGSKKSDVAINTYHEIIKISPKSKIYYANVTDINEVESMTQAIKKEFNHLDILINNAGVAKSSTFGNMSNEDWDLVIKTNVYGTFYVTKAVLPLILESSQGRIINMSSVYGLTGAYGQINYSTSKAAIIGFTKALAKELAKHNILVNAICPGIIDTGLVNEIPEKYLEEKIKNIPLKRIGRKEEVAKLVAFITSQDSSYITGQTINIDGGML